MYPTPPHVPNRYAFFTFDTVYAKHVVDTVRMTNWGRVFYGAGRVCTCPGRGPGGREGWSADHGARGGGCGWRAGCRSIVAYGAVRVTVLPRLNPARHLCAPTPHLTPTGNFMALPPLLLLLPALGEHRTLAALAWAPHQVAVLALSCLMGLGMSHASYLLREAVSATFFTIIGILCKV